MTSIANKIDGKDRSDNKIDEDCPMTTSKEYTTGVCWQHLAEIRSPNCVRAVNLVLTKTIPPAEVRKEEFDAIQKAMQRKSAVEYMWARHDNAVGDLLS